jgi:hypothetical protein
VSTSLRSSQPLNFNKGSKHLRVVIDNSHG